MALKGSSLIFLLSLVLLVAWQAVARGLYPNNDRFLRRHWDNPKTRPTGNDTYCDLQGRARGLPKRSNIYIHSLIPRINRVCTTGGIPIGGNRYRSKRRFRLTRCRFSQQANNYTETRLNRRIVVICRNRLPVRLVRPIRFQTLV